MIALLGVDDGFPPVESALDEPNGLLAVGGGLSLQRLLDAYARGIFPWFSAGDPVLWWCPDPRMVLPTDAVHLSKSLRKRLRRDDYRVTFDQAFTQVLEACAAPRDEDGGTWLLPPMQRAYQRLFAAGAAHSVEVWQDDAIVGGLYGVSLGRMFFGESMFTRLPDASKLALVWLAAQLRRWQVPLIDCQVRTEHLSSLGAIDIRRQEFVRLVADLVNRPSLARAWVFDADLCETFQQHSH